MDDQEEEARLLKLMISMSRSIISCSSAPSLLAIQCAASSPDRLEDGTLQMLFQEIQCATHSLMCFLVLARDYPFDFYCDTLHEENETNKVITFHGLLGAINFST